MDERKRRNRKDQPILLRLLNSVSALLLIGTVIYVLTAGFDFYSGILLTTAVLGVGVPTVIAGDGLMDTIAGFFEAILDGLMGIVDGIFSIFN